MVHVTTERHCLTLDGRVVSEDDPEAHTLLFPAGQVLSDETARHWGLGQPTAVGDANDLEDDMITPPENKAVSGPQQTKRGAGRPPKNPR